MSSSSGWLPPTGGPESPRGPSWSPPQQPSPPAGGWQGSIAGILVGVVSILVGFAAIALQSAYKLDAEALLTGGSYISDEWRLALLLGGVTLAAMGLTLVVAAGITRGVATIVLLVFTSTLLVIVLAACTIAVVALANAREDRPRELFGQAETRPVAITRAGSISD